MFGMFSPGGSFGRAVPMEHFAEIPEVLGTVPPIADLGALATERGGHFVPNPLRAVTQHNHRAQDRFMAAAVCCAPAPADDVQCATSGRFGAQATGEWRSLFARGHITGRFKMRIRAGGGPPADDAELHFVPRTAVGTAIVVAHHHSIRLNYQHTWRRRVQQLARRLLRRLHLRYRSSLLAFTL